MKIENINKIPHNKRPWEIAAFAKANILTNSFYSQPRSGGLKKKI